MKGFLEFIRTHGVIGLAVGLVMGGAVSDLVKSLVQDIIQPLLGLVLNNAQGLKAVKVTVFGADVLIGSFLVSMLNFAIVAAVIYYVVMGLKLDQIDKKKEIIR